MSKLIPSGTKVTVNHLGSPAWNGTVTGHQHTEDGTVYAVTDGDVYDSPRAVRVHETNLSR